jgi:hypothetical protein
MHKVFVWGIRQQHQCGAGEKTICAMPHCRKDTVKYLRLKLAPSLDQRLVAG